MNCYRGYQTGSQPSHNHPPYVSSLDRHPKQPLIVIPHTVSEVTGPQFHAGGFAARQHGLTKHGAGEPVGERIVVSGRVMDQDGNPVRRTLVEVWQANAAGRYLHKVDQHDAPLDPNFKGSGHMLTDDEGRYRFVTIKPGAYPWRESSQRLAAAAYSLFAVRAGVCDPHCDTNVFSRRSAVAVRPDL